MSKIPEGATHTLSGATVEYKKMRPGSHSMWLTYVDGDWIDTVNATPQMYAPINPEWSGEGLPPVGVEIEAKHKDATPDWARPDFYKTEIVAIGKQLVIFAAEATGCETVGKIDDYEFRPVRTPEQIEEANRLGAVDKMREIVTNENLKGRGLSVHLGALYDAGLRFVEVTK